MLPTWNLLSLLSWHWYSNTILETSRNLYSVEVHDSYLEFYYCHFTAPLHIVEYSRSPIRSPCLSVLAAPLLDVYVHSILLEMYYSTTYMLSTSLCHWAVLYFIVSQQYTDTLYRPTFWRSSKRIEIKNRTTNFVRELTLRSHVMSLIFASQTQEYRLVWSHMEQSSWDVIYILQFSKTNEKPLNVKLLAPYLVR